MLIIIDIQYIFVFYSYSLKSIPTKVKKSQYKETSELQFVATKKAGHVAQHLLLYVDIDSKSQLYICVVAIESLCASDTIAVN